MCFDKFRETRMRVQPARRNRADWHDVNGSRVAARVSAVSCGLSERSGLRLGVDQRLGFGGMQFLSVRMTSFS
jgi:hypothetical protein